jgi:hypothetical protein
MTRAVGGMRRLSSAMEAEKRWRCSSVDSSVVGYSLESNDLSTEAEESPLLGAITSKRLVKTLQAEKDLIFATVPVYCVLRSVLPGKYLDYFTTASFEIF